MSALLLHSAFSTSLALWRSQKQDNWAVHAKLLGLCLGRRRVPLTLHGFGFLRYGSGQYGVQWWFGNWTINALPLPSGEEQFGRPFLVILCFSEQLAVAQHASNYFVALRIATEMAPRSHTSDGRAQSGFFQWKGPQISASPLHLTCVLQFCFSRKWPSDFGDPTCVLKVFFWLWTSGI